MLKKELLHKRRKLLHKGLFIIHKGYEWGWPEKRAIMPNWIELSEK